MRGGQFSGKRSARGALAAATAAAVLLVGSEPASAGDLPDVTMTGTPGPVAPSLALGTAVLLLARRTRRVEVT